MQENTQVNPNVNTYSSMSAPQQQTHSSDTFKTSVYTILKTCCFITGPGLIVEGVFSFSLMNLFSLVTIFGLLVLLGEIGWKKFLKHFPFLMTRSYRGFFIAFAGSLSFAVKISGSSVIGTIVGIWSLIVGILSGFFGIAYPSEEEQAAKVQYQYEVSGVQPVQNSVQFVPYDGANTTVQ